MTPDGFRAWQDRLQLQNAQAATLLGVGTATIERWRRDGTEISRVVALACKYVESIAASTRETK